jgi:hypothetical protein
MAKNPFIRKFNLIYFTMIASMSFFGVVVYFLCGAGMAGEADANLIKLLNNVLAFAVPLFLIAGHFVFQQVVKRIDPKLEFEQRLSKYGTALLIRSAFLEVPGLLISAVALLTGRVSFLLLLPLVIITFIVLRPKVPAIATDLNLSSQEKKALEI